MTKGTYKDFRDALRALESGWDRARYDAGLIHEWYLDQQAGGPVGKFYPGCRSWSELSTAEWDAMSYRSMDALGFVGYHFGEGLLADLGYYVRGLSFGTGASSNSWDGVWTGKNGVHSLEDFKTAEVQEVAIREAFGYYLDLLEKCLAENGRTLYDFLGTTLGYVEDGKPHAFDLSLTGILADAHLRGVWGTLLLLQNDQAGPDAYRTTVLRTIERFNGYDAPTVPDAIAFYRNGVTDSEGPGTPDGGGGSGGPDGPGRGTFTNPGRAVTLGRPARIGGSTLQRDLGNGTAGVTEETADVVLKWDWGTEIVISNFNPATDTIYVGRIIPHALEIREVRGAVVFEIAANNQSLTLERVSLDSLSPANFTIPDDTTAAKILRLIGGGVNHAWPWSVGCLIAV